MPSKKLTIILLTFVIASSLITIPFLKATLPISTQSHNKMIQQDPIINQLTVPDEDQNPLEVEKTVWNNSMWDEEIIADIGENIRFNLTISDVIMDSFALYDIYVNDTLPDFLTFNGNVTKNGDPYVDPDISGSLLSWYITTETILNDDMYIEFDALAVSSGTDINLLEVSAQYCNPYVETVEDSDFVDVTVIPSCEGKITGVKFNDSNGDGIWNCDEETLSGWTINLYKDGCEGWELIDTIVTSSGGYEFDDLCPGTYKVSEEMQPDWINTTPHQVIISLDAGQSEEIIFGNKQESDDDLPQINVTKTVWNGIEWADYALVNKNDIVTFNVSVYNPFDSYNLTFCGVIFDEFPCHLTYNEESSTLDFAFEDACEKGSENYDELNNTVYWRGLHPIKPHEFLNFTYTATAHCDCDITIGENTVTVSPSKLIHVNDPNDIIFNNQFPDWDGTGPNASLNVSAHTTVEVICDEPSELTVTKSVKINCNQPYSEEGVVINLDDPRWVTFKIVVEGDDDFDSVIVEDGLPDGLETTSDLFWDLGNKEGEWSEEITFTADVIDGFCGNVTNWVNVTGINDGEDEIIVTDTAWVDVICEEEEIKEFSVTKLVKANSDETYSEDGVTIGIDDFYDVMFKIEIEGTGFFDEVIVIDDLPYGLELPYDSDFPEDLTWYLGPQEGEWSEEIIFTADVIDGFCGNVTNWVNVTGQYGCEDEIIVTDTAWVDVICGPDVEVTKQASLDGQIWTGDGVESFIGDTVWFKLIVKNNGFEVLEGVNIYDYLPSFLVYDEMIDGGGADDFDVVCADQPYDIRWFFTEIDINETIEIVFTTESIDVGFDENIVIVTSCGGPSADDSVDVLIDEGMYVLKKVYNSSAESWVNNISVLPGETILWNINISFYTTDSSQPYLHHLVISDILPDELTYIDESAVLSFSNGTIVMVDPEIEDNELIWNLNEYFLQSGEWLSVTFETLLDSDTETGLLENFVVVTGKDCSDTSYELEDMATVYVTEFEDSPPEITNRSPADESSDVDIDALLSVTVDDPEGDVLTVVFYDVSDDSIIKEVSNINSPKTVEATWTNLEYNTTYEWYVNVSDHNNTVTSSVWSFTTIERPSNLPPADPTDPNPVHNAPNVIIHPTLSVQVSDPDGDTLTVEFYNAATDQLIGSDECISDCRASTIWTGRAHDTTYSWYVTVSDGEFEIISDVWSFTTKPKDIDLDILISGGIGINVDFINNGMDDADDVTWDISIENRGILNRINKTSSGTLDIPADSMKTETLRLFNIGRITVDVTVDHPSLDEPLTAMRNGFVLGIFVRL